MELLDEYFMKNFGFHSMYPEVKQTSRWAVKPDVF